jgi:hypothetical protein
MTQTAVEWLFNQMSNVAAGYVTELNEQEILDKAKEMEKEQIIKAASWTSEDGLSILSELAEQYYNETFKSE